MLVLYTDSLKEAWRLNIIWAAPQSKLNLEVRRKSAYLRASGNRKEDISGWLIYLSIYFTINFGVKVSPWENGVGNKCLVVKGVWKITVPMALQFISGAAPPKQAEENQLLETGKKLFLKNWIFEWCTGRKGGLLYQWIGHWLLWSGRLLLKSREVYLIWFQNVLRRSQILAFVPVIHVL